MDTTILLILALAAFFALIIYRVFFAPPVEQRPEDNQVDVVLSPHYTLNNQCMLLIDNQLLGTDLFFYQLYIYDVCFSPEGEVYIRRQINEKSICWEKFDASGESLGIQKKRVVRGLLESKKIGRANSFLTDKNSGEITVFISL